MFKFIQLVQLITIWSVFYHLVFISVTHHKKVSAFWVEFWDNHLPVSVNWVHWIDLHSNAQCFVIHLFKGHNEIGSQAESVNKSTNIHIHKVSQIQRRWELEIVGYYRASYASAVLAVIVCLTIRPSVRLSQVVKNVAKPRITLTMPYNSPGTLVFRCQKSRRNSNDITPNGGAK